LETSAPAAHARDGLIFRHVERFGLRGWSLIAGNVATGVVAAELALGAGERRVLQAERLEDPDAQLPAQASGAAGRVGS
jgi:hypothetical protein